MVPIVIVPVGSRMSAGVVVLVLCTHGVSVVQVRPELIPRASTTPPIAGSKLKALKILAQMSVPARTLASMNAGEHLMPVGGVDELHMALSPC